MNVLGINFSHDSAAVLLSNGDLVAAVEEERLNRVKHCEFTPIGAAAYCLQEGGIDLADVDTIAFGNLSDSGDYKTFHRMLQNPRLPAHADLRSLLAAQFHLHFGIDVTRKMRFVEHHIAHALSAYAFSGHKESLVVSLDGAGDGRSGSVFAADSNGLRLREWVDPKNSVGLLYERVTSFLGYRLHDEYKVMGLAPYGDPERFSAAFADGYRLRDDGRYKIKLYKILDRLRDIVLPRRSDEPFEQVHKDIAASLQAATETIVLHYLAYHQRETGFRQLCYAGGLAHNCSLNGRLIREGLFDEIYVQPASSDAGVALGAAVAASYETPFTQCKTSRRHDVFLGPAVETGDRLVEQLDHWRDWLTWEQVPEAWETAAELLAAGQVLGWVQGRSEFGPRALGNRCILADPRPAENRARINDMIKKREAFLPFAPSVLETAVDDFFIVPGKQRSFPHMSVVLEVREEWRAKLGAVTHVDGTARVQTVHKKFNGRFWELISAFGRLTRIPMVLNTSFNSRREPIVQSADDALTCFLTTGLDALIIDDYLIRRRSADLRKTLDLYVTLCPTARLSAMASQFAVVARFSAYEQNITADLFRALSAADGTRTARTLFGTHADGCDTLELSRQLLELWSERLVELSPDARSPAERVDLPKQWMGHWA